MKYKVKRYREDVIVAREREKMLQGEVASRLHISTSSWQKYEYGERTPKGIKLREAIRDLLGIPVESWDAGWIKQKPGPKRRGPVQCKAS